MISSASITEQKLFYFDEFRSNLQTVTSELDEIIKKFKEKDDDPTVKILLYLYQGFFLILDGEKKYRTRDYNGASNSYVEGGKLINRFQRMSSGFSLEIQQEAERMDLFSKGRNSECQALKQGTTVEKQLSNLLEAINSYTLEAQIVEKINNLLMRYNAKAREYFARGLSSRIEGEQAFSDKDLRLAKRKHLDAYRSFIKASYYNPTYSIWINEQNETIKNIMKLLIEKKANTLWREAFSLSNEGKFIEQSERCNLASKLYLRASNLAVDIKKAKVHYSYSFMLKATMYEAIANDFVKHNNDAKSAVRQYELAAEALKQAIDSYPKEDDKITIQRWKAQEKYYQGNIYQTQGIFNLDSENYNDALNLFTQAEKLFLEGIKIAEEINEDALIKLLEKSVAEAKGYIGMCKTVVD